MTANFLNHDFHFNDEEMFAYYDRLLEHIRNHEGALQALVPDTFVPDQIICDLREMLARSGTFLPLRGLPLGVKDIFRVNGLPTRCGSELPAELFEGPEAPCVTRLKEAGAIVIAKTVTAEFAAIDPGPTRNPINPDHTPGGSSSGSAAGIAKDFFQVALGTQTQGSITRPAAFCGVIGIKPSFGRIPVDGVVIFSESADHIGFFLSDLKLAEPVLSVLVPDWRSINGESVSPLTLGIPEGPYLEQATPRALHLFRESMDRLAEAGHTVKSVPLYEDIGVIKERHVKMITREFTRNHEAWLAQYPELYRPGTVAFFERDEPMSDDELDSLQDLRLDLRNRLIHTMEMEELDAWVSPSAIDSAPKGLASTGDPAMNILWTNSGLPTISLPSVMDDQDLHHGIQVAGRFNQDEETLQDVLFLSQALAP